MPTSRRSFLGLLAAPAIVRASSLMRVVPVRTLDWTLDWGDPVVVDVSDLVMERGEWRGMEIIEDILVPDTGLDWTGTEFVRTTLPYRFLNQGVPYRRIAAR